MPMTNTNKPQSTQTTCVRCGRTITNSYFYSVREVSPKFPTGVFPVCKDCMENIFKADDPSTFMHYLYHMDFPWLPTTYKNIKDAEISPMKPNPISIFGKYISKLKLVQYKGKGFQDSDDLQIKSAGVVQDSIDNYDYNKPYEFLTSAAPSSSTFDFSNAVGDDFYMVKDELDAERSRIAEEDSLNSASVKITKEEKTYLTLKWGVNFSIPELLTLERMYQEFATFFSITNPSLQDDLIKRCKISLRYDMTLDNMDMKSAKEASGMYEKINKNAGFQPIQQGGNSDLMASTGYLVKMVEEQGSIPVYNIEENPDIVDATLKDFKLYVKRLVDNDDTILERLQEEAEELAKKQLELARETPEYGDEDKPYLDDIEEVVSEDETLKRRVALFDKDYAVLGMEEEDED